MYALSPKYSGEEKNSPFLIPHEQPGSEQHNKHQS